MFFIIFTLFILWIFYECYWKGRNLPPGPTPVPLVGNFIPFLWNQPGYKFMKDCKKKYGNVYTFWMGTHPIISIADYELMKETFVKDGDSYIGKYDIGINEIFRGGKFGIIESEGDRWREHRRFALHQLRDLGLGKMKMEERIMTEVEDLCHKLSEKSDINVFAEFHKHVANVVNQLLFGYRFEKDTEHEFESLIKLLNAGSKSNFIIIIILFPWTKHLPIFKKFYDRLDAFRDEFFGFFQKQIDQHKTEINFDQEDSTDYVEAYLKEKRKREAEGDFESFCDKQLLNCCFDMWAAGLSTTTATLCWGLLYILHHPEVQKNLHKELTKEIGSSRPIKMADKNKLTYTMAVINEIQRALNMLPSNLPHSTTKDVTIEGYKIPKGTTISAQISHLLYDETLFPDPEKFDPERFIDENGKLKKFDEMLPFSIGKRQCPGEGLARMELFLFIANIFNRFTFSCKGVFPPLKKNLKNIQRQPVDSIDLNVSSRY